MQRNFGVKGSRTYVHLIVVTHWLCFLLHSAKLTFLLFRFYIYTFLFSSSFFFVPFVRCTLFIYFYPAAKTVRHTHAHTYAHEHLLDSKQTNFLIMNDVMACCFASFCSHSYSYSYSIHSIYTLQTCKKLESQRKEKKKKTRFFSFAKTIHKSSNTHDNNKFVVSCSNDSGNFLPYPDWISCILRLRWEQGGHLSPASKSFIYHTDPACDGVNRILRLTNSFCGEYDNIHSRIYAQKNEPNRSVLLCFISWVNWYDSNVTWMMVNLSIYAICGESVYDAWFFVGGSSILLLLFYFELFWLHYNSRFVWC